jgi:hypothetical protein
MMKKKGHSGLLLKAILGLLVLPFWLVVGLVWIVIRLARFLDNLGRLRFALQDKVRCPAGHSNPVEGTYECGHCHGRYRGTAWLCPLCGSPASYISCNQCGLSIRSPFSS